MNLRSPAPARDWRTTGRAWLLAAGDWPRFPGALVGLNLRKSLARVRGRRCACQNPSDSGRAGETGCDAAALWHRKELFRVVCPALQLQPGKGWRCSVDRAAVRPYWGRAAALLVAAVLVLHLVGSTLAWGIWRRQGIAWGDVAWPGRWSQLAERRSEHFVERARAAVAARELAVAELCLRSAIAVAPHNHDAIRSLAALIEVRRPSESDALWRGLLTADPTRAEATARLWLPALLARGDFAGVQQLAASRLAAGPREGAGPWLRALELALERTREEAELERLMKVPTLAPGVRAALELMAELHRGDIARGRARFAELARAGGPGAVELWLLSRALGRNGRAQEAVTLLEAHRWMLPDRDYAQLRLGALAAAGEAAIVQAEVEGLLSRGVSGPVLEVLSAHLLRWPDEAVRARVSAAAAERPRAGGAAELAIEVGLFCVAARAGDEQEMARARARIEQAGGQEFAAAPVVAPRLSGERPTEPVRAWLPLLRPLSMDVLYALLESSPASRAAAPSMSQKLSTTAGQANGNSSKE